MSEINLIQTLDSKRKNMEVNTQVITLDDNLFHPYFVAIDVSKNNYSPIGTARIDTVYSPDILKYWQTYTGVVVISFEMKDFKKINTNSVQFHEQYDLPQKLQNDEYNYSFVGKVSKIKHKGKEIIIYCEDLGWKFLQKVPKEFRDTYIANQPIDQAFQAICEFLDIEFAYSIEDMKGYTFGADGYSIQKDGQTIENVETILSQWETKLEEEGEEDENEVLDDKYFENSALIELDNKNKDNEDYVKNDDKNDNKIIETTEDQDQLTEYQEEFEKKILDLFIGNKFYDSDLTSPILHYDHITVTPTANTNTTNNTNSITETNANEDANQTSDQTNNNTSNTNGSTLTAAEKRNKKPLSMAYIRTLMPSHAAELAKQTDKYEPRTIKRLRRRAIGAYW